MTSVDEFLSAGAPSYKFTNVGDSVRGTVLGSELRQKTKYGTNEPMVWDDGNPQMQLVITLATDERSAEIADDDGERRVFAGPEMQKALKGALKKAGNAKLRPGGTLVVKYSANGVPSKPGFNPPKLFECAYRPPADPVDEMLAAPEEKGNQPSAADLL